MNPEFIEKIKDGLTPEPLKETGDALALSGTETCPLPAIENTEAMDGAALETGYQAADVLATTASDGTDIIDPYVGGWKRGELSAITATAAASSRIFDVLPKTLLPRGESPFVVHLDEVPFMAVDPAVDADSMMAMARYNLADIEGEVPRADDIVLVNPPAKVSEVPTSEMLRSASEELNTMMADLKRMRKHYPVVAGRVVHLKKRTSKTRKKKK